jgi:hypothetical protein
MALENELKKHIETLKIVLENLKSMNSNDPSELIKGHIQAVEDEIAVLSDMLGIKREKSRDLGWHNWSTSS